MALLHHYVVNELSSTPVDKYRLVGDDLLFCDAQESYEHYVRIMSEIGVGVNPSKTLISSGPRHTLEFARTYIIQGHRVNPMPVGALFAYYSGTLSGSEVMYAFLAAYKYVKPLALMSHLGIKDRTEIHTMLYFLWRERVVIYELLVDMCKSLGVQLSLTEAAFEAVRRITAKGDSPIHKTKRVLFTESLMSQCTIRREEDFERIGSLTADFAALQFAGDEIAEYSQVMHDRLLAAFRQSYLPGLGEPTT
jgi:hypothetical protein